MFTSGSFRFYLEGTAVGTGNTLQITIDVTRTGNYTIYTLPNDGVSFTASGNFADTGLHVVILKGSGAPDTAGIFTLKIPGEGGCNIMLNIMKKAPASYTLSGYPNDCGNPLIGGIYVVGTSIKPDDNVTLHVIVNTPGDYSISTDTIGGISFAASGQFTTSGAQTVVLGCNGLPENPGLFSVFLFKMQSLLQPMFCNMVLVLPGLYVLLNRYRELKLQVKH